MLAFKSSNPTSIFNICQSKLSNIKLDIKHNTSQLKSYFLNYTLAKTYEESLYLTLTLEPNNSIGKSVSVNFYMLSLTLNAADGN